jgi:membrane protease YdiL (CAAX protease family)
MRLRSAVITGIGVAAAAIAARLFPHALPIVALEQSLTRDVALARADSFFRAHSLAPTSARTAVQFQGDDSLRTFVELAGGGPDSLNALVRGDDVAPFTWSVRAFLPGNPREAHVDFAPDGRIIGFEHTLAEEDARPALSADSGRRLAEQLLDRWIDDRADRWKLVTSSYETQKTSGRVDRSYTFERTDRRIGGAPIRAEAVIAGDTPAGLHTFVEIPQSFQRRYAEMRSWNDLLARLAALGTLVIAIIGAVALTRYARQRLLRWRPPMLVGAVVGALALAAALNEMPGSWFSYDTAMSPVTFLSGQILFAVLGGAGTALLLGFTLAAAEAASRQAFPRHLDWWKLWRYRGTREVAFQVGGGYAVATIALAYVAAFYVVTRTLFGWWVPAVLLDDPNQIATPLPWITGIAMAATAAVWEEALFRALPLSLLSLWTGHRPTRRWWMAAGVLASALIFGFAHAGYESWPPYSRGVEILLDACFWAVLFVLFGLLVTVVAHFVYDLVLFGIFAAVGDAVEYRVTAAIIAVALFAPALAVLWRGLRQRGFTPAPEEARFSAWTALADEVPPRSVRPRAVAASMRRTTRLALAAASAGFVVAVGLPPQPTLGPQFTAQRGRVLQSADSMLRARGGDPAGWTRLTTIDTRSLERWERFLDQHGIVAEAERFASSYVPPTWWVVRYVHTRGSPVERTEEWTVRLSPDGRPLEVRHILPDSAPGRAADTAAIRRIAVAALTREGVDTSTLRETEFRETARPARRDVTVTYTDTTVKLPAGAAARVRVEIAGDEPLGVRRGVELPEAFLRADRARQTNRMVIAAVAILLLVGFVITGAIAVKRRPVAVHDGTLERRTGLLLVGGLALLAMLSGINSLRSELSSYDTAQPWSTFVGSTTLGSGVVGPVVFTLVLAGLWLVLGALRRRVGIPMLADVPSRSGSTDVLIWGLGLGGVIYAASGLEALIRPGGMPRTPTTDLNDFVPVLAGIPDIPAAAIMAVTMVGIPILVVAGLTSRWSWRVLVAGVILTLAAAIVWSFEPVGDVDPAGLPLLIASFVVTMVAIIGWGARSAWSWIVAALTFQGLDGLHQAVYGPEWQARGAGALSVLVATGLIALIVRRATPAYRERMARAEAEDA